MLVHVYVHTCHTHHALCTRERHTSSESDETSVLDVDKELLGGRGDKSECQLRCGAINKLSHLLLLLLLLTLPSVLGSASC